MARGDHSWKLNVARSRQVTGGCGRRNSRAEHSTQPEPDADGGVTSSGLAGQVKSRNPWVPGRPGGRDQPALVVHDYGIGEGPQLHEYQVHLWSFHAGGPPNFSGLSRNSPLGGPQILLWRIGQHCASGSHHQPSALAGGYRRFHLGCDLLRLALEQRCLLIDSTD